MIGWLPSHRSYENYRQPDETIVETAPESVWRVGTDVESLNEFASEEGTGGMINWALTGEDDGPNGSLVVYLISSEFSFLVGPIEFLTAFRAGRLPGRARFL